MEMEGAGCDNFMMNVLLPDFYKNLIGTSHPSATTVHERGWGGSVLVIEGCMVQAAFYVNFTLIFLNVVTVIFLTLGLTVQFYNSLVLKCICTLKMYYPPPPHSFSEALYQYDMIYI